ncbi:MAG: hypothetical protein V3T33_08975 [Myxococcota bacterium]
MRAIEGKRWWAAGIALVALGWLPAQAAAAPGEPPRQIDVLVVVSHISNEPGEIDPRAGRVHRKLSQEFRYNSLKVLEKRSMKLGIDEVGGLELPNGRKLRVKPLLVDKRGALLAIDLQGLIQTDLRVKNNHLVIIGADRYEQGKLVISLEAHF